MKLEACRKVYDNGRGTSRSRMRSFDVADGEFLVLVGPSGCGKSTTLRMIAGLESVTAGKLSIGDRVVNDVPAEGARHRDGVPELRALSAHDRVREHGLRAEAPENAEAGDRPTRARGGRASWHSNPMLDRKPRQLSGGQRQRVALGRAIVRQPQVFLFDEPLSNLDAKLRVQTRARYRALHQRLGATMIYVTHDQVEAMTLGDRIVVMNAGVIQQIGTPLELYERPANLFVAGFIGSPAMNMLRGRTDGRSFVANEGALRLVLPEHAPSHTGEVVLGIRPEHIYNADGAFAPPLAATIEARVNVVEPMGNETFLYANAGGHDLVARLAPQPIADPDSAVKLVLDLDKLHFFEAATGTRLVSDAPVKTDLLPTAR